MLNFYACMFLSWTSFWRHSLDDVFPAFHWPVRWACVNLKFPVLMGTAASVVFCFSISRPEIYKSYYPYCAFKRKRVKSPFFPILTLSLNFSRSSLNVCLPKADLLPHNWMIRFALTIRGTGVPYKVAGDWWITLSVLLAVFQERLLTVTSH